MCELMQLRVLFFSLLYRLFNDGKKDSPNVKTIMSVLVMEGYNDMQFQTLYTKDDNFQTFARNVLGFLRSKAFDGFNIYWQTTEEKMIRGAFPKLLQVGQVCLRHALK